MGSDGPTSAGAALLLAALWVWAATVPAGSADLGTRQSAGGAAVRPQGCEDEAALVKHRLELRPAPDPATPVTVVLMPGASVYRCEPRGAFVGVMFPEEGGRADCSTRPPERECPTGWAVAPLEVEITG
jgi:hypothetical protein